MGATGFGKIFPTSVIDYLRSNGIETIENPYSRTLREQELVRLIARADGTLAGSEPYNLRVLTLAPRLKIIARVGVGYDMVDVKAASARGIRVTWTPIPELSMAVAEHTFALLFALLRRVPHMNQEVREGKWDSERWSAEMEDLHGLTMGLLGTGRIGGEVAKRAKAFEMSVIYTDVVRRKDLEDDLGLRFVSFDELLSSADVLSIHIPLKPETRGMINAEAIKRMKRSSVIINTARGAIIDETALAAALRERRIAGAALDVLSEEPPSRNHVFYKLGNDLPNLILTEHSAIGLRTRAVMAMTAARDVVSVLSGGEPVYLLNGDILKRNE